ncbi:MAG: Rpn family recombination-promoting nuclease/putative transposase [Oscillospiraceae bacterium]|nr:Rpn family recombination-promoting nuclease/putative transposase [Oscillospiraceae bacterium]
MNSNKIIKLKLDIIFKAMFGTAENEQLLANFLSSILEIPRESIKKIIMDNVELIPDNYADKFSRVDLKMQVDDKIVNVELQINSEPDFAERTLYYWSRIYGSELKSGESYGKLKETICINIVNFNLFDCNEYHSHFKIMEKTRHEVLTNKFGIHFFELKKIGKHPDKNNHMQLWLQLINAETEEELDMLENTNVQEINQAIVVLRKLNADEKMRYLAEMREKSLHDEVSALEGAKEEGIAEGIAQGIQKGIAQGIEKGIAQGIEKGIAQGIEKGEKRKEDELIEKMRKSGLSDEMINNILNAK